MKSFPLWLTVVLFIMETIDQPSDCCFTLQINDVVKIQAFIRANKARDDYKTLSEYDPHKCDLFLSYELGLWVLVVA